MSKAIREKKKKMEEEAGAVKLSGIPEDATDIAIIKNKEYGERLSENKPKDHDEEPSLDAAIASDGSNRESAEMSAPDPMEEDEKKKRMMKMRGVMAKLGK